jgi:hypothetical protein
MNDKIEKVKNLEILDACSRPVVASIHKLQNKNI